MIKNNILNFFKNLNINIHKKLYVAYSGGLDSTVLLHILHNIKKTGIYPIHINHNIKNYSKICQNHCLSFSKSIKLNLIIKNINKINVKEKCLEAKFRIARYKSFFSLIPKGSILILAHHEQDLVETYLFRLFKGGGCSGLSSIKPISNIFGIKCIRPFLVFNKQQLYKYAIFNKLHWCEDPTNKNNFIARNYIRHNIINNISKFWPSAQKSISRSIKLLQIQNKIFYVFIKKLLIKIKGKFKNTIDIKYLLNFDINLQLILIRSWLNINKIIMPTLKQINHIYIEILLSKIDSNSIYHINNAIIKKYNNNLFILKKKKYDKEYYRNTVLIKKSKIRLNNKKLFKFGKIKKDDHILNIKFKIYNDKIKKKMQEKKIPPWKRKIIPLIFYNNNFLGVSF